MDPGKLQARQAFSAAVQAALDAYRTGLEAEVQRFLAVAAAELKIRKEADHVKLRHDTLNAATVDTLLNTLQSQVAAAVLVNGQNPLTPEDVEALKAMLKPQGSVSLEEEKSSGFLGGVGAGAALGGGLGSVVPGVGTAIGAILGGMWGGVTGAAKGHNERMERRMSAVRRQVDASLAPVKAAAPGALTFVLEKCLKP